VATSGTVLWLASALAVGWIGLLVIVSMQDHTEPAPPTSMFAAAGLLMSIVGFVTVAIAARRTGTTVRAAIALGGGFAAIALAKFAMGPTALFQGNRRTEISSLVSMDSGALVLWIAVSILVLYIGAVWFLAAAFRPAAPPDGPSYRPVVACLLIAVAGGIGTAILVTAAAGDYLVFILSGLEATGIAVALFAATLLVAVAFRDTAQRSRALGATSIYITVAWVAISFLLVFQVLWIVFLLAVVAIWPLRTVTPK
jgi:hypothetical protein